MSTVGHLFVGAAASRFAVPRRSGRRGVLFATLLTVSAIAPDLDLVLPALGAPDSLTLGHRGATHSLAAALAITIVVALLAKLARLPARRLAIGTFLAIGSHALLDSLTAGPGVAWLWPLTSVRFPTFPILPIAPIDDLFTRYGLTMLLAEAIVFSPFLAYAIFARPNERAETSATPAV
jgi:inner membrane protein